MNRIQILILNEQIYGLMLNPQLTSKQLFEGQNRLVTFSCEVIKEIDKNNDQNSKLISLDDKFATFEEIDLKYYDYLIDNFEQNLEHLEENLLSSKTMRRLPLLLKSLYITYLTLNKFTKKEQKNLIMNEIIEISKLYLEPKFVKMLNKIIDDFGN